MNHEVEREVGELAKLRRFRERVMALRDEWLEKSAELREPPTDATYRAEARSLRHCAADIDEALKEVGSE